jgi:hypothetical protein
LRTRIFQVLLCGSPKKSFAMSSPFIVYTVSTEKQIYPTWRKSDLVERSAIQTVSMTVMLILSECNNITMIELKDKRFPQSKQGAITCLERLRCISSGLI